MQTQITDDFTDERFRQFVKDNFCGGREAILKSDIDTVTTLVLAGQGCSSFSRDRTFHGA
ncbi:hypothetical protein ACFSQ7_15280 [Paenibacillus rhizoplanae]